MKKLLLFIGFLLIAGNAFAGPAVLFDTNNQPLGTASNPLVVTGGGGSSSGGAIATYTVCAVDKTATYDCDYTADGTNDQTEINQAITAAAALTYGGTVFLTEGHFNISASIVPKSNVKIVGAGMTNTVLLGLSGLSNTAVVQDTTNFTAASPLTNFEASDFKIDGTSMNHTGYNVARKGFYIRHLARTTFRNLYIYNTPASGLGIDFLVDSVIDGNIIDTCGTAGNLGSNGIGIGTAGDTAGVETDEPLIITNNITKNNANTGIVVEGQSATVPTKRYIIANNISYGNYDGIRVDATSDTIVSNNQSYENTNNGLFIDGTGAISNSDVSGIIVDGNLLTENGLNGIEIQDEAFANKIIVSNNIVRENTNYGVSIKSSNSIVEGNIISDNGLTGLYVPLGNGTVKEISIYNNTIINNGITGTVGSNDGINILVNSSSVSLLGLHIKNNVVTDNQATKTQRYGLAITNNGFISNFDVLGNFFDGNATGETSYSGIALNRVILTGGPGVSTFGGGINVPSGTDIQSNGTRINYYLSAYASGTVYALTNSSALVDFGTTDPDIVIDRSGTYLLRGSVQLKYNAATFAANQTATCKIRRINNTAADLTGATRTIDLRILTTLTDNAGLILIPETFYNTTNTNDELQIFCTLSASPGAGSVDAVSASITAQRMF